MNVTIVYHFSAWYPCRSRHFLYRFISFFVPWEKKLFRCALESSSAASLTSSSEVNPRERWPKVGSVRRIRKTFKPQMRYYLHRWGPCVGTSIAMVQQDCSWQYFSFAMNRRFQFLYKMLLSRPCWANILRWTSASFIFSAQRNLTMARCSTVVQSSRRLASTRLKTERCAVRVPTTHQPLRTCCIALDTIHCN